MDGRTYLDHARRLLEAHGLPPGDLSATDGGIVHPCVLSPAFAVRFNTRDPELPKFATEATALAWRLPRSTCRRWCASTRRGGSFRGTCS